MTVPSPATLLYLLIGVSALLIAIVVVRPSITARREGKMLAFVAFCFLPVLCVAWTGSEHIERSKQTTFCLSCHIMEPYGKSLYIDNASYVPAAHFQNHRIPADEACYTCHTDYGLYGGFRAKFRGLRHIYIEYFGNPPSPDKIQLYSPYNNRECLHCHEGARSFESNAIHMAIMDSITSNQMSCVTSGCHDMVHPVANLNTLKFWKPVQ